MDRRKLIAGVAAIVVLVAGAWALGIFGGADPAAAELQQLGAQMFDPGVPEPQRDQLRDDFRKRMGAMSDDQRRAFFDANRDQWMGRIEQRMDAFFEMSPADQQKRLDEIINRMIEPGNQARPNAGGNRGGWGGGAVGGGWSGGGGNMTEAQRDERAKSRLDRTSPKMRAQLPEFRRRLDERAKERGIGELPGWGFPGGGRGA